MRNGDICPSPEKQKIIVMNLLSQSPVEGEAFFLINYQWWKMWCRYVNIFMDYEYSLLKGSYSSENDPNTYFSTICGNASSTIPLLVFFSR